MGKNGPFLVKPTIILACHGCVRLKRLSFLGAMDVAG